MWVSNLKYFYEKFKRLKKNRIFIFYIILISVYINRIYFDCKFNVRKRRGV